MGWLAGAFTAGDVVRLAQVTYRELRYWVEQKLIVPEKDTAGTGDKRLFDFRNLVEARVIKQLRNKGMSLQKIRRCVEFLRQQLPQDSRPLSEELLLTDGTTIYWCRNSKEVVDTLKGGQMVFAIAIADVWNEMKQRVEPIIESLESAKRDAEQAA